MKSRLSKTIILILFVNFSFAQVWNEQEKIYLQSLQNNISKESIKIAEKLITIAKKEFGDTSIYYSKSHYYLGQIQFINGANSLAIRDFELSKKYFKKENQKNGENYHSILNLLSLCYFLNNDFEKAYSLSFELLKRENENKTLGNYDYKIATNLYGQICLNVSGKEETGAKVLSNQIYFDIDFLNKIHNNPQYADYENTTLKDLITTISLVHSYYLQIGNLSEAIKISDLLNKLLILKITDPNFVYQNLQIKKAQNIALGNEAETIRTIQEEINLIKNGSIYENGSIDYYCSLGQLFSSKGDYYTAIQNYEFALKKSIGIIESSLFPIESIYKYLSFCYQKTNNYNASIAALEIARRALLKKGSYTNEKKKELDLSFAYNYYFLNNYTTANKIIDNILFSTKTDYKTSNYRIALDFKIKLLINQKDWVNSYNFSKKAFDYDSKSLINLFIIGTNKERGFFLKSKIYQFDVLYSLCSQINKTVPNSAGLAYNSSLLTISLLLESEIAINNSLINSNDTNLINTFYNLKSTKSLYSKLSSEGSVKQELMAKLEHQSDSLDHLLSRIRSAYSDYTKNFSLTWQSIQSNLSSDEAAIEFVRYYNDSESSYYYMALIVRQGDKYPQLIKLCSEDELKQYSPETELKEIYDLVWKPLLPSLTNIKTIYYSPSGLLNNIPFQALYKQENDQREYVMDKFTLHQLTSSRYLALDLKKKEQEPIQTSIALFGGINYNDYPNAIADTTNHNESSKAAFLYKNAIVLNRELDSTRAGATYLPGTKKEVETIANVLKSKQWQVDISEGKDATENKIKSLSGNNSKSILHIATHGFAYPDKEEKRKETAFQMMGGNDQYKVSDNPMIRSGLLFGGANMTWLGKGDSLLNSTNEDGVLTAYELSQLDLSNTKLAVLSACETGKGAIQGSEGTFGLKRALKLAGVDNMIVSLWKVPDEATMEMMTIFYTELANTKKPVSSFETAQKAMRIKYPEEPNKWAGFVFVR